MKRLLPLFLSFGTLVSGFAQDVSTFTGSLFWEISGNGLEKPSYIFGSNHGLPSNFALNYPGFKSAFGSADRIITEYDEQEKLPEGKSEKKSPKNRPAMKKIPYHELLSEREYRQFDSLLILYLAMPLKRLSNLHPSVMGILIELKLSTEAIDKLNIDYSEGRINTPIDSYIEKLARDHGKETAGLETKEHQVSLVMDGLFDTDIPSYEKIKSFIDKLMDPAFPELSKRRIENYCRGNIYETFTWYSGADYDREDDEVVAKRNDRWMAKLPAMLHEKSNLIVVGAMHLAGEVGLLYRLSEMGYTVVPVE